MPVFIRIADFSLSIDGVRVIDSISILILQQPLILEDGFQVSMIELPAPRPAHMYPTGLESTISNK